MPLAFRFRSFFKRFMATTKVSSKEGTIPFKVGTETYQTWYRVFGDIKGSSATPLVALHGGPALSHDYLLPISDLAVNRPVIFYDQIGNSRSTHLKDKPTTFWTIDLFIDELVNLLKFFNIESKFDIIGHSWGGILGAEFEVRRKPAGLQHLILTNSLASMALWNQSNGQLLAAFPREVQEGMQAAMSEPEKYQSALAAFHAVHGCTVKPIPKEFLYSMDQVFGANGDHTVAIGMFGGELKDWDIIDRLSQIRVSTFVINGRGDIAQDFVVEPFFLNIPKVKWVTLENATHTPMWEDRERYMHLVEAFLKLNA